MEGCLVGQGPRSTMSSIFTKCGKSLRERLACLPRGEQVPCNSAKEGPTYDNMQALLKYVSYSVICLKSLLKFLSNLSQRSIHQKDLSFSRSLHLQKYPIRVFGMEYQHNINRPDYKQSNMCSYHNNLSIVWIGFSFITLCMIYFETNIEYNNYQFISNILYDIFIERHPFSIVIQL